MIGNGKRCKRCILTEGYPNISFDENGICNFCRKEDAGNKEKEKKYKDSELLEFEALIHDLKKNSYQYDAICCYSGGKDSTFMLKMMTRDFGLNVLAFTLDNGFITEQAKRNINLVTEKLSVDHIFFKPSSNFLKNLFRSTILGMINTDYEAYHTRISSVCLSCITLINHYAVSLAWQNRVPMVFSGFTPGQIPKAVIKNAYSFFNSTYERKRESYLAKLGNDADKYFRLDIHDFDIYQMAPYLVYEKSEDEIIEGIKSLGWKQPENLDGCTSNCALNSVGNIVHEQYFGFHPYVFELSQLVRLNLLTREQAILKVETNVSEQEIIDILKTFDLTLDDIRQASRK